MNKTPEALMAAIDQMEQIPGIAGVFSEVRLQIFHREPMRRDDWAYITSSGWLYVNPQRQATAAEWVYILSHCCLHLALGHIHKRTEPLTCGRTVCAWPGCPEGRGFDELGEKGFYAGTIDDTGKVALTFVPFARRRYEILTVDVTGQAPRAAIEAALPTETVQDLYRILLTGETGEGGAQAEALQETLADRFYALEIRDQTRLAEDLWARAAEDSLRGLFLRDLKSRLDSARTEEERQRITMAARFGLAALDHRDLG